MSDQSNTDPKKKKGWQQAIKDFINAHTPQGMALTPPTAVMEQANAVVAKRKKQDQSK